jgi:hypothetical protein
VHRQGLVVAEDLEIDDVANLSAKYDPGDILNVLNGVAIAFCDDVAGSQLRLFRPGVGPHQCDLATARVGNAVYA